MGAAFDQNFKKYGEIGAAFSAVLNGKTVIDIWGGLADREARRPWTAETLQVIFSGSKGLVAICMLMLVERNLLRLDDVVQKYWKNFRSPEVRVRDILSHTARLPGVDALISLDDFSDDRRMADIISSQAPSTDPRSVFCYHPFTYGWLCGELLRQVDGRNIAEFFAEEIAQPLDLEIWFGIPTSEEKRVATLELSPTWGAAGKLDPALFEQDPLAKSVWGNPEVLSLRSFPWNRSDYRFARIPGAGAIGTVRSIAKLYGCLAQGGAPLLKRETIEMARKTLSSGYDVLMDLPLRFGVGFQLQTEIGAYGPPKDAFGHNGAGGSSHGVWPTDGIGYSYAMNFMRDDERLDPRLNALLAALHDSVDRVPGSGVRATSSSRSPARLAG